MPASTNDTEVEQVLSAIRNLIVQSRTPERPTPLLLTPELRIVEPSKESTSAAAAPDGASLLETTPAQADAPDAARPDMGSQDARSETPLKDDVPGSDSPSHLRLVASSEPSPDEEADDAADPLPAGSEAAETSAGASPAPSQGAADVPDLAGFLALVGVPPGLGPVAAPAEPASEPVEAPQDSAADLAPGAPEGSDAWAEEPAAWVEPGWPELAPAEAPDADPAALPGSALGALLAEEAPAPSQDDAALRKQVAVLVREALEGEMDRLRGLVREEVRLALNGSDRS